MSVAAEPEFLSRLRVREHVQIRRGGVVRRRIAEDHHTDVIISGSRLRIALFISNVIEQERAVATGLGGVRAFTAVKCIT